MMNLRHDHGSMPLALLAIITIGGIVAALFTITVSTQRSVRQDRNFQVSINGSDAGVQQAATQINELNDDTVTTLSDSSTVGATTFTWEAERIGNTWEVTSTGTTNQESRRVEAEVSRDGIFDVAAFADVSFDLNGNSSGLDSYDSQIPNSDQNGGTGNGSAGSNGEISVGGFSGGDSFRLYGPNASCDCDEDKKVGSPAPYPIDEVLAGIQEDMDAACDPADFEVYNSDSYGQLVAGTTYCFSEMNITGKKPTVTLGNSADGTAPSLKNPVIVYLTGGFDAPNGTTLNCPDCPTPDAGRLQVYSLGQNFTLGNQSLIAGAFAFPNASCGGGPSSAQTEIFGSLICNEIGNQGGWKLHYDDNLRNLVDNFWDITAFREELPGETSFGP